MQRKKMGQIFNSIVPGSLDDEPGRNISRRHCLSKCKGFLTKIVGYCGSVLMVVALVSSFAVRSYAQVEQPYTATLQPRSTDDLQRLVAPIALYPDELVAQVLAASTYPTEVVQADRWVKSHSNLQGERLAAAVDQQPWDASVKALTAFPSVLSNMDQNLSWTTELGEVYFNQQQDLMNAIQAMRQRAQQAGNLSTTTQERVSNDGPTIVIQPAYPDVCYLPQYDPWLVYGTPVVPYPGYYYGPWFGSSFVSFGPGIRLGFFSGFGWGWPAWGFNWGRHVLVFNRVPYVSHSTFFYRHGPFVGVGPRGNFGRFNHPIFPNRGIGPNHSRSFPGRGLDGRPGSFDRGGSFRGHLGGGPGRGFGGGFHGGGFHGGGGRHR